MAPRLIDNPPRSRFELLEGDDLLGWVDYRPAGSSTIIAHTEVAESHHGQGLGGQLVRSALDAIQAQGKTVIAVCPFAEAYIRNHDQLWDFLDPSLRPNPQG